MFLLLVLLQMVLLVVIGTSIGVVLWYIRTIYGLFASGRRFLPFELSKKRVSPVRPFKFLGIYGDKTKNNVGEFLKVSAIQSFFFVIAWTIWSEVYNPFFGLYCWITYLRLSDRMDVATLNYENPHADGTCGCEEHVGEVS